jgi:hypothetical protein
MSKEIQKNIIKNFRFELLIQEIDNPVRTPTKETKIIQDKARELQTLLEPVLSKFYENKEIKQPFFYHHAKQFNFILIKSIDDKL